MACVSLLVSCHGTGQWLPEALASIPWGANVEVLITSNGAENADAVAGALVGFPNATRIYREQTIPLSDSLNYMLCKATAPYVMRLDPDDKLPPGTLKAMVEAAHATPSPALVYGGFVDFGGAARVCRVQSATVEALRQGNPGGYNILIDTRLARQIGGWQEVGYEDWHFFARLVRHGAHPVAMSTPTLLHRVRSDGRYADFVRTHAARVAAIRALLEGL
jgi:hypothetical protein